MISSDLTPCRTEVTEVTETKDQAESLGIKGIEENTKRLLLGYLGVTKVTLFKKHKVTF